MWSREDLLPSLMDLGLLRSPELMKALRSVDQAAFLPEEFAALAYADQPLPVVRAMTGPTMPSARCLVAAPHPLGPPPEGPFDRILVMDPTIPRPRDLTAHLADLGFLIARGRGVEDLAYVKVVRRGDDVVRITVGQAPAPAYARPRPSKGPAPVDYARLFAAEDL